MTITYGQRWFRAKKRLTEVLSETQAKTSHDRRQLYVALIDETPPLSCFIEMNDSYVGVGFLDELRREYLSYQFQEISPARLFLSMATHRSFVLDSDKVSGGVTFLFSQDGRTTIRRDDFIAITHSVEEARADVSGNWENYPAFSQYNSIIRQNR